MNNIDFVIGNNESIVFNTTENQDILFNSGINENNIDMDVMNNNQEVDMDVSSSGSNMSFQLRDIPFSTNNYKKLVNKPSINSVVLIDNKTSEDLGLQPAGSYANSRISNIEIDQLFR